MEREHQADKQAAQARADAEKAALEAKLAEMHHARREDRQAMAELKREAET